MSQQAHKSWLLVTAFVIGSFGPIFALGSLSSTAELARWSLDLLSWPLDGLQTYADPTTRFLSALTGGFLFGWGVMVLCLRQWVYDVAPEGIRRTVLASVLAWFILDSVGSWASGNPSNVLFNLLVLVICVGPLWRPAVS
jgi:fructose-specific phosphotransferase system IIC component